MDCSLSWRAYILPENNIHVTDLDYFVLSLVKKFRLGAMFFFCITKTVLVTPP